MPRPQAFRNPTELERNAVAAMYPGMSLYERRVAWWLNRNGWESRYRIQVNVGGGRTRRGGTVVDFVLDAFPKPIALYPQSYWHKSGSTRAKDAAQDKMLTAMGYQVIRVPEEAILSDAGLSQYLRRTVGRP